MSSLQKQYIKEIASRYAFPIQSHPTAITYSLDTTTVAILETYGSSMVTGISLAATPIMLKNIRTPAKHVYLILQLHDTTNIVMEKHDRTELSVYLSPRKNEESIPISMDWFNDQKEQEQKQQTQTLSQWIANAIYFYRFERGGQLRNTGDSLALFWSMYHVTNNNCQQWVWSMLLANGFPYEMMEREPFRHYNQKAEEIKKSAVNHIDTVSNENNYHPLFRMLSKGVMDLVMDHMSQVTTTMARAEQPETKEHAYAMTADGSTITYYDQDTNPKQMCIAEERTVFEFIVKK
jgi:hypothetical protein